MGDIVPVAAAERHLAATNQIRIASLRLAPARGRTGRDAANDAEKDELLDAGQDSGRVEALNERVNP